jgi:hypothetical protein
VPTVFGSVSLRDNFLESEMGLFCHDSIIFLRIINFFEKKISLWPKIVTFQVSF